MGDYSRISQKTVERSPVATVAISLSALITNDVSAVIVPSATFPIAVLEFGKVRVKRNNLPLDAAMVLTVVVPDANVADPKNTPVHPTPLLFLHLL